MHRRQPVGEAGVVQGVVFAPHRIFRPGADFVVGVLHSNPGDDLGGAEASRAHHIGRHHLFVVEPGGGVIERLLLFQGQQGGVPCLGAIDLGHHLVRVDHGAELIEAGVAAVEHVRDRFAEQGRIVSHGSLGRQIDQRALTAFTLGLVVFGADPHLLQPGPGGFVAQVELGLIQGLLGAAVFAAQTGGGVFLQILNGGHAGGVQHPFQILRIILADDLDALVAFPQIGVAAEIHVVAVDDVVFRLRMGGVIVQGERAEPAFATQVDQLQHALGRAAFPIAAQTEALGVPGARGAVQAVEAGGALVGVGDLSVLVAVHDLGGGVVVDRPQLGVVADDGVSGLNQVASRLVHLLQTGRDLGAAFVAEVQTVPELRFLIFIVLTTQVEAVVVAAVVQRAVEPPAGHIRVAGRHLQTPRHEGLGIEIQALGRAVPGAGHVVPGVADLLELRAALGVVAGHIEAKPIRKLLAEGDVSRP